MNQKNFDYLKDGLKYLGFGEGLNNKLAEELASGKPEFQINTVNEYGRDKVNYKLDFRKSDQSDMYFFNKYTAKAIHRRRLRRSMSKRIPESQRRKHTIC